MEEEKGENDLRGEKCLGRREKFIKITEQSMYL